MNNTELEKRPTPALPEPGHDTVHAHNGAADHAHDETAVPADLPKVSGWQVVLAVGTFALLFVILFVIGYVPSHRAKVRADALAQKQQGAATVVSVVQPVVASGVTELRLPCDVKANQVTALYTRTNGYLKQWNFDIQDKVQAGQVMAVIEAPEVDAQLAQSKAALEQQKAAVTRSQADLDLANVTLARYVEAQKTSPGSVTQEDLDTKKTAVEGSAAALKQSQANEHAAEENVKQLAVRQGFQKIIAPFSGTVTSRNYDVGALLSPTDTGPGKEIFNIAQTDTLRVFVNVPQTYATAIRTGQDAFLTLPQNYPAMEFKGVVARTSASLDATTRTLAVQINIPNKDGRLYAGMYGEMRVPITSTVPVMRIPTSALVFDSHGLRVGTVRNGKLHVGTIQVGRDLGTEIEVTQGLTASDDVVSNPTQDMTEDMQVQVKRAPAAKPTAIAEAK